MAHNHPVWREWSDPNPALCRQGFAAKKLRRKTVAIQEPLMHRWPEPAARRQQSTVDHIGGSRGPANEIANALPLH
jgi:hypothetical protein